MKLKKGFIYRIWNHFQTNSLFQNAIYLMLGTTVLAGFGFIFWLLNAHLYSIENIGLATTLISVMNLIAILSLVGFDSVFVRFLPTSAQKNEKMNTGIILVSFAACMLSCLFILGVNFISPRLSFIRLTFVYEAIFVLACVMNALNVLTDSIFLAGRKTLFSLVVNIILSIFKILIPFVFISYGAMGIFISAALAQTLGTILSFAIMIWKFEYKPIFRINKQVVSVVWKYSIANYLVGVLSLLPPTILPILITNNLGPEVSAYYYIVMMIGNLLYTIPWSVTKSLFAEGSHDETKIEENTKKSIRMIAMILLPCMVFLMLSGRFILGVFGKSYSNGGIDFLYFVIVTGIAISINSIFNSYFRVKKVLKNMVIMNIISTVSVIGFSYVFLSWRLIGLGIAWIVGNSMPSFVGYSMYRNMLKPETGPTYEH